MWYRNWISFACAAMLAVGCSSSPDVDDDVPREGPTAEQRSDEARAQYVARAYEDAAQWLPSDSAGVYIQSTEPFWDMVGDLILPMADPDAEPGSPGTVEGLRADLIEFSRQYFGFDSWKVDTTVIAVHGEGGRAVLFGDFDTAVDLPTVDVSEETAYVVDLSVFLEDDLFASELEDLEVQGVEPERFSKLYLLPIDEPRTGFVATLSVDELERLLAAGDDETLATSPAGDRYAEYFSQTAGAEMAVVASVEEADRALAALEGEEDEVFDDDMVEWVAFSYGDALKLTLTGERRLLERLEARTDDFLFDLGHMIEGFSPMLAGSVYGDLAIDYLDHKVESIASQVEPRWLDDDTLRYELALSGGYLSRAWGASSVALFFTVPLFLMDAGGSVEEPVEVVPADPALDEI